MAVVIETTVGDITVDLFIEERPLTCKNFLKLCKMKYYNFCLFHSIQHNFIAQTGDPTGTGKGGESVFGKTIGEKSRYYEGEQIPKIKHFKAGLVSMVNCGDNMLGSQFFITLANDLQSLDGEHCVFGEITEGEEVLMKLNDAICDTEHRPYQDIRITHTVVLEDPFDDPPGLIVPDSSPEPTKENLANARIAPDEEIDDTAGRSAAEIEEMVKLREAQARATILEMVGDLPDADIAPPENVLFVCKLNPVTTDDDLEIIFSRYGKINSCEVIRDKTTGDSLQYAFIEFDDKKACEDAYFKMDNVLIDDRRIHVDFSQSVSKYRWLGKGRGVKIMGSDEAHNKKDVLQHGGKQSDRRGSSKDYPKHRDLERRDQREERDREKDKERGRDRDRERERERDRDRERERDRGRDHERYRERDRDRDRERERDRDRDRERDRERERVRERERRDPRESRDSRSYKDRSREHSSKDADRNGQRSSDLDRDRRRKDEPQEDTEKDRKREQRREERDDTDRDRKRDEKKDEGDLEKQRDGHKEDVRDEDDHAEKKKKLVETFCQEKEGSAGIERKGKKDNGKDEHGKRDKERSKERSKERVEDPPRKISPDNSPSSGVITGDNNQLRRLQRGSEQEARKERSMSKEPQQISKDKTLKETVDLTSQNEHLKTTCNSVLNKTTDVLVVCSEGSISQSKRREQSTCSERMASSAKNECLGDSSSGSIKKQINAEESVRPGEKCSPDHIQNIRTESKLKESDLKHCKRPENDPSYRSSKHARPDDAVRQTDDRIKKSNDTAGGSPHISHSKRKAQVESKIQKTQKKRKRNKSTSSSDSSDTSSSSSDSSDSSESSSSDSDQKSKSKRRKKKKSVLVSMKSKKKPKVLKVVKKKKKKQSETDTLSDDSSSSDDHRSSKKKKNKKSRRRVEKVVLIKRKRKHSSSDESESESESSASSSSSEDNTNSRKKRRKENEKKSKKKGKKQVVVKKKNGSLHKKKSRRSRHSSGTSSSNSSGSEDNSAKLLVPD